MTTAESCNAAGAKYAEAGDWVNALECFRAAAVGNPAAAAFQNNAGVAALKLGLLDEAERYGLAAAGLDPASADYAGNLAGVYERQGELGKAASYYGRAIEAGGGAPVLLRLGAVLCRLFRFVAASRVLEAGLAEEPEDTAAWNSLAFAACSAGDLDLAQRAWAEVLRRDPSRHAAHSARLVALHYPEDLSAEAIFEEHRRWGEQVEGDVAELPAPRSARPSRIRLGYLAPHPIHGAVASFSGALAAHHDGGLFDIVYFSDADESDAGWHATSGLTNRDLAALIRKSEIDVLVDLGGHSSPSCRLVALAERPAPVQITMIGYPDTTGLTRMDYRVTDSIADPPGAEARHTEGLLRLDPCFLCYTPPDSAPEIAVRDVSDPFTFGCFNTFPKLTRSTMRAWARILTAVPDARLVLKCLEFVDPDVRSLALERLREAGADAGRVELLEPPLDQTGHLAEYGKVDVFLDCFPYNGTTTTCEALWMGVPGVTLSGATHVSRVGGSLMAACGLEDWVTATWDGYVSRALRAARDRELIREARMGTRDRLRGSPLLDAAAYVRRFEELIRGAWQRAGSTQAPRSLPALVAGRTCRK